MPAQQSSTLLILHRNQVPIQEQISILCDGEAPNEALSASIPAHTGERSRRRRHAVQPQLHRLGASASQALGAQDAAAKVLTRWC